MCNTKAVVSLGVLALAAYSGGAAASAGWLGGNTSVAAGAAMGAVGGMGVLSAVQQQQVADSQAKLMDRQQQVGLMQAKDAMERGAYAAEARSAQVRKLLGEQRAAQAANGGMLDTGTNEAITKETTQVGALDTFQIEHNAALEAWGYTNNADVSGYMSSQYKLKGQEDFSGTLLTTGAQVYGIYNKR